MSDLARLLQQYGYAEPQNPLGSGATVSTQDVMAGMPRPNALADALKIAGAAPKEERGFLFSNIDGQLKFNPWEAVKGFMSYQAPPGALSTSGDDTPVRNAADVAGWVGLSGLGLNAFGAVPANALGSAGAQAPKAANRIIGYHGSPHEFKPEPGYPLGRFKNEHIGTGEGAQAYGFGHYIAENEDVARRYRDALRPIGATPDKVAQVAPGLNPLQMSKLRKLVVDGAAPDEAVKSMQAQFPSLAGEENAAKLADAARSLSGHMYEVAIHATPDQFLDWDKPLSQQSEAVRKAMDAQFLALKERGVDLYNLPSVRDPNKAPAWQALAEISDRYNTDKLISDSGLPGVKYLDQHSRGAGSGSRNYVVNQPDLIEILRKYGLLGPVAAGATANALMGDKTEQ